MTMTDQIYSLDDIELDLGPLPLGPVIGGEVLMGDPVLDVLDPGTERSLTTSADRVAGRCAARRRRRARRRWVAGLRPARGTAATCSAAPTS